MNPNSYCCLVKDLTHTKTSHHLLFIMLTIIILGCLTRMPPLSLSLSSPLISPSFSLYIYPSCPCSHFTTPLISISCFSAHYNIYIHTVDCRFSLSRLLYYTYTYILINGCFWVRRIREETGTTIFR